MRYVNNFRQSRKLQLVVLMVLVGLVATLSVAYAVLSTTLTINGNTEISAATWDIHFDNIQINPGSVTATTAPTITDSKTINFAATLSEPGDYYKFNVDIVNEGTIDAMIDSVVKSPTLTEEQAKYIKYEIEYSDGNSVSQSQLLSNNSSKTLSVMIAYRNDISASDLPSSATTLSLAFTVVYTQADSTATAIPDGVEMKVVSGDLTTQGSEVAIGDEHFYVLSNDGSSVTMLSKYNLHVGNEVTAYDMETYTPTMAVLENPTGIQDSTAIGAYVDGDGNFKFPWIGTVAFSSTNYWAETTTSYPSYVYNSSSIVYEYVENYKTYLQGLGATVEEARLLTYEELVGLGCSTSENSCTSAPSWVYSTSYWTGSAFSSV